MESLSHLTEAQRLALDKIGVLIGIEQIDHIVTWGRKVLNARLEAFVQIKDKSF